jgi:rRNA maturation protein Nop10
MHPARLSLLANKHQQFRAVIERDVRADGTRLTLECGHETVIAPHFDASHTKQCGCHKCGESYVRAAPQYAAEFSTTT